MLFACVLSCFSLVWLYVAPWTLAHQAPLSMGFSRQECWGRLSFPSLGDLSNPGIKPASLMSPAFWQMGSLPLVPPWNAVYIDVRITFINNFIFKKSYREIKTVHFHSLWNISGLWLWHSALHSNLYSGVQPSRASKSTYVFHLHVII